MNQTVGWSHKRGPRQPSPSGKPNNAPMPPYCFCLCLRFVKIAAERKNAAFCRFPRNPLRIHRSPGNLKRGSSWSVPSSARVLLHDREDRPGPSRAAPRPAHRRSSPRTGADHGWPDRAFVITPPLPHAAADTVAAGWSHGSKASFQPLESRRLLAADVGDQRDHAPRAPRTTAARSYVELYNRGDAAANLAGWHFDQGITYTFPAARSRPAATSSSPPTWPSSPRNTPACRTSSGRLSAGCPTRARACASSTPWGTPSTGSTTPTPATGPCGAAAPLDNGHQGWEWVQAADGGAFAGLINPALTNDTGQNWASSVATGGTPGARQLRRVGGRRAAAAGRGAHAGDPPLDRLGHRHRRASPTSWARPRRVALFYRVDGAASFTQARDARRRTGRRRGRRRRHLRRRPAAARGQDRRRVLRPRRRRRGHARTYPAPTDDAARRAPTSSTRSTTASTPARCPSTASS
jgi:hypothetical protein